MTGRLHSSVSSSSDCAVDILRHIYGEFSRPSSVTEEELERFVFSINNGDASSSPSSRWKHPSKTLSLPNLSSVRDAADPPPTSSASSTGGVITASVSSRAKELLKKYLRKARSLIGILSPEQLSSCRIPRTVTASSSRDMKEDERKEDEYAGAWRNITGYCKPPVIPRRRRRRRRSCISSCTTSSSSPCGSAQLKTVRVGPASHYADPSSMQELQEAIQGAIAHCKNSMVKKSNDPP